MPLSCRLFGHRYHWLSSTRQCHCRRCGKPDNEYLARQAALEQIMFAAPTSFRPIAPVDAPRVHPDTMIGRQ